MKFMVVDGEAYIAGGRNISDEYFGLSTGYNFIDRDVLVRGLRLVKWNRVLENFGLPT